MSLMPERANAHATTVYKVLTTPWPWASGHMSAGPHDCDVTPSLLHPAFHASFDWHSSVHMQWSAATLLATGLVREDVADRLARELDSRLTFANCRAEANYLVAHPGWERPYGWGWALRLAATTASTRWETGTSLLVDPLCHLFATWLPTLSYPVRHGVHSNTAFGLTLARDGAVALGRTDLVRLIDEHALRLFGEDRDYDVRFEPSGNDFLSPALAEAALMRRVLGDEFASWFAGFLPSLEPLLGIPEVRDLRDGQAVHLFGLALSKAAHLRALAEFTPAADHVSAAADALVEFALPQVADGDFMSTHWLVSFVLLSEGL